MIGATTNLLIIPLSRKILTIFYILSFIGISCAVIWDDKKKNFLSFGLIKV